MAGRWGEQLDRGGRQGDEGGSTRGGGKRRGGEERRALDRAVPGAATLGRGRRRRRAWGAQVGVQASSGAVPHTRAWRRSASYRSTLAARRELGASRVPPCRAGPLSQRFDGGVSSAELVACRLAVEERFELAADGALHQVVSGALRRVRTGALRLRDLQRFVEAVGEQGGGRRTGGGQGALKGRGPTGTLIDNLHGITTNLRSKPLRLVLL